MLLLITRNLSAGRLGLPAEGLILFDILKQKSRFLMPAPIVVEHKKYQIGISCYYMLLASFNFVKYSLAVGPLTLALQTTSTLPFSSIL